MKKRKKSIQKKRKNSKRRVRKMHHFTYIFAILNLVFVVLLNQNPLVLTGLLLAIGIWGLLIWNSKRTLAVFFIGLIFGIVAEFSAVKLNLLNYSFSSFYGLSLWVAVLLGNFSAFIYQKATEIKERKMEKNGKLNLSISL